MTTIVFQPEGIRIPGEVTDLARFREWAGSTRFPELGRIDWVSGEIEIDMSPEDLNSHGTPKSALTAGLHPIVEWTDLGIVLTDSFRWTSAEADLSCEPDVLVVLFASLESGRVRLVERKRKKGRFVEVEGAVDLVIECVSDSSVEKDLERFPRLYYKAGATEYWVVDARSEDLRLTLYERGPRAFRPVAPDRKGFRRSGVLGRSVRLQALPPRHRVVRHVLETRD